MDSNLFIALIFLIGCFVSLYGWRTYKTKHFKWTIWLTIASAFVSLLKYFESNDIPLSVGTKNLLSHLFLAYWVFLVLISAYILYTWEQHH
jgi:hypothetical protein